MNVRCENCSKSFEAPVHTAGKIEYARCKNVFRVTYRFRTPCPQCRRILQLAPHGTKRAIGIALNIEENEKTEAFMVSSEEATVPRMQAVGAAEPIPTIRVSRLIPKTEKKKRFRLIEKDRTRPTPVHVALRPDRKEPIPWLKITWISAIVLGVSMIFALIFLAIDSKPSKVPVSGSSKTSKQRSAPKQKQKNHSEDKPGFQGGPDDGPTKKKKVWNPPTVTGLPSAGHDKVAGLKFPRIDRLTSGFGTRVDPIHNRPAFHGGIDIAGEERSEVRAALDGKVTFAGRKGGHGNAIVMDHGDGYETVYSHLSKPLVRIGEKLRQGDLIGLVGSTGRSTGPHLHFELRKDGKTIDPLRAKLMAKKS